GVPDREGALRDASGLPLRRLAPDTAAAEVPRPRPLLVADEVAPAQHDGRVRARAPAAAPGDADWFQPARAEAALRGRAEAARGGCLPAHRSLRRRQRA